MNEDELATRVRAAYQAIDPVPQNVLAAARAAISWRLPGAGLAELTQDRLLSPTTIRGTAPRVLTFASPDTTVELEVVSSGHDHEITGRLSPAGAAHVRLRRLGAEEATTQAGPAGRFAFPDVREGLISLVFDLPDATSIVTSWIRL